MSWAASRRPSTDCAPISTLPNNIRLHGFVPPAETERLCLAFDVLLAPYQSDVRIAGGGETGGVDVPAESVRLYGSRQAHSLLGSAGPARGHRGRAQWHFGAP